jgi:uncharacterized 2Fe-2S/4Fe-4S cluster protein (DUF4445 family)
MSTNKHQIRVVSSGRRFQAVDGQTLLEVLAVNGIQLRSDCGGKGVCEKCLVQILPENGTELTSSKYGGLAPERRGLIERLACQTEVHESLAIEIPATSVALAEVVAKPLFFRRADLTGSENEAAVVRGDCVLAVDLGTTTIALFLCDLDRGRVVVSGSVRNPQFIFGDDVMSRISAASAGRSRLVSLQEMVVAAVNHAAGSLAAQAGMDIQEIKKVLVVGNPTMVHLFLGVDPSPIGVYPYLPVFFEDQVLPAGSIGLALHPNAQLHTLPLIAGFLGSDIIAAGLANDIDMAADRTMLIDVGTNGEIILNVRGELVATSCATGPAFEGAAIRHGVYAVSGAVDSINVDPVNGSVSYSLIQRKPHEREKAVGICGAGVVSAVAALVRAGIISNSGAFNLTCNHPNLRRGSDGLVEFLLVPTPDTRRGADITLTQKDVRAVQLAKAAILTGISLLCREANIRAPEHLLIAGAFGSSLDKRDAKTIGMVPPLPDHLLDSVGNAAGEGAVLALLRDDCRMRARDIARRTRVVDLAAHPDFQEVFLNALSFPNRNKLPDVAF